MPAKPAAAPDFKAVSAALADILRPYTKRLDTTGTPETQLSLNTRHILHNKNVLFFASFQPRKNYVSYYLMPVYMFPELLAGISPALRKRMQGKSCFNFKTVEPELLKELAALTKAGFERYEREGFLQAK